MRRPLKKQPADPDGLLALLQRWREEAVKAGHAIGRIAVAFEAVATASGWRAGCAPAASGPV